jgi:iron complex transport system substrate-binding protein
MKKLGPSGLSQISLTVASRNPNAIVYEAKMYPQFDREKLRKLIESRGWTSLKAVKREHVFLTPGPLDFLAHHGHSFILEAIPWLSNNLSSRL